MAHCFKHKANKGSAKPTASGEILQKLAENNSRNRVDPQYNIGFGGQLQYPCHA
jgi:hypothetical protein